ncbi:MAG: hypothetical protein A2934_05315 [Candidatus Sungbacteria bacterium RIFCSPLOWO2_01_FULL_47_10]|uniref:Uncharacterized protein n=1 Tax=Candidatus Sungbacteria bacterium RIFCSPLOWO2_01_FULL_47_10 TaxID=1802276 RepID=A0A1G2L0I5_9BACT|nr:MAG: hypothetical protein A2934_05315 [Candidatus Sungbacteria bacterium RIFCSPLOWO2_01_FULL_47_10]
MLKKISSALAILFISIVVTLGILYKVRSLPNYQSWPLKSEGKFFGYFVTRYEYDTSSNWVREYRTEKGAKPEYIVWHFTKKGEKDMYVYFAESTYKSIVGLYFPTRAYEQKHIGHCKDYDGRNAQCYQSSWYISVLGVYFTEESSQIFYVQ